MSVDAVPRLGLVLPEAEREMGGRTARWSDYLAMATTAESMGFDSLWFPDHLLYLDDATTEPPQGAWECWSVLAALAASTTRVQLGPLVTASAYRNPALLAKMADTLDEISGGRLILAVGSGWVESEFRMLGLPGDHPVGRFEEALTVICGLLRDGAVDLDGAYYQVRDAELRPRGPRAGGIPIMIGAEGPRMLRLTARFGDAWNVWLASGSNDPGTFASADAAMDAACVDVGRDRATLERTAAILVDPSGGQPIPPTLAAGRPQPISGSADEIAAVIRAFGALGVSHLQLVVLPNSVEGIRAMAPVLQALGRA